MRKKETNKLADKFPNDLWGRKAINKARKEYVKVVACGRKKS